MDILELLAGQARPLASHEIAATLGIPSSSLSYLLSTLVERGYVDRSERLFVLGPAAARLGHRGEPGLAERAAPIVRALTRELNETAGFFLLEGHEIEALATEIGGQALRYAFEVGARAPLHAFAAGKAILAALPPESLDAYFAGTTRERFTARTITDEPGLRADLNEVRRCGIARSNEEHTLGIAGIARAIALDGGGTGAFSVAVPVARLDEATERRTIELLGRAVGLLAGQRRHSAG